MRALIAKEIRSFFNGITGYLVIVVYLLINSMVLWLFPNSFNILEGGYASMQTLFIVSPWIFMFLIPAITMRMFADEKRAGTMEILLTKPVTDFQIVWAKVLAGIVLVFFSILPTLVFYVSVYKLASPVGNVDVAGTIGSYVGLMFLGSSFVGLGVFASSLTANQVVSFIIGVILTFFFFIGFDQIAGFEFFGKADLFILNLGINEHYNSLSRGVIDSRDVLYFFGFLLIFSLATRLVLQSRKW